ncbi:MAG: hypothetical protein HPZ86_00330 [Clostridia bacterium]|nr:hypothetical protein [Clostridia bacterium]
METSRMTANQTIENTGMDVCFRAEEIVCPSVAASSRAFCNFIFLKLQYKSRIKSGQTARGISARLSNTEMPPKRKQETQTIAPIAFMTTERRAHFSFSRKRVSWFMIISSLEFLVLNSLFKKHEINIKS